MKLKLAATVFALTWIGSAMAADPVIYDPAPVPAPDPVRLGYDWNGAYAGLHLGYGWGRGAYELTGGPDESGSFGIDGLFGGVTLGADMQNGPWVFGVIGDFSASGIRGSTTAADDDDVNARILWMGTLRGRAGYAFDNVLPYATGGLALASSRIAVLSGKSQGAASISRRDYREYALIKDFCYNVKWQFCGEGDATGLRSPAQRQWTDDARLERRGPSAPSTPQGRAAHARS